MASQQEQCQQPQEQCQQPQEQCQQPQEQCQQPQEQQKPQRPDNHHLRNICHGTINKVCNFNPEEDANALRKAMKGLGTDEKCIIDILTKRNNAQRQEIIKTYQSCFERDLISDLKSELTGHFEDVIKGLMLVPREYDAYCLHKAVKGPGTDEDALIEILCSRSNDELAKIKEIYKQNYEHDLEKDIVGDTSGDFKKLLVALAKGCRDESCAIDECLAKNEAEKLYKAGEKKLGTDEDVFRVILTSRNFMQLCATFEEYQKIACKDIIKSIESEFSGDMEYGLKSIVKVARNTPEYFADALHESMKGVGTSDTKLIRIIVSRSEIDLVEIKYEFLHMYKKSLEEYIKSDTSGDYKRALISIVEGN